MAVETSLTIEDFESLPDALARNHELLNGELIDVPVNTVEHNDLRDSFVEMLRPYVRDHDLGKVLAEQEYAFGEDAHGPDVTLIGPEKPPLLNRKRRVQPFVPDLAIEVVSTNDKFTALVRKARTFSSPHIPGFSIRLGELFDRAKVDPR